MTDQDIIDLSGSLGIAATIVLTINLLLGMMLSTAYRRSSWWKRMPVRIRNIDINSVHNWTAYLALAIAALHPLILTWAPESKFTITGILFPLKGPHQPWMAFLGSLAFYAVLIVIITTQKKIKQRLGFRKWKNIHLVSYGTACLFVVHGIFMDPHLKDNGVDWLDGEKIISDICFLALVTASYYRYNYYVKTKVKDAVNG